MTATTDEIELQDMKRELVQLRSKTEDCENRVLAHLAKQAVCALWCAYGQWRTKGYTTANDFAQWMYRLELGTANNIGTIGREQRIDGCKRFRKSYRRFFPWRPSAGSSGS